MRVKSANGKSSFLGKVTCSHPSPTPAREKKWLSRSNICEFKHSHLISGQKTLQYSENLAHFSHVPWCDGFALALYLPVISAAARSIKSIADVQQFQRTRKSALWWNGDACLSQEPASIATKAIIRCGVITKIIKYNSARPRSDLSAARRKIARRIPRKNAIEPIKHCDSICIIITGVWVF